MTKAINTYLFMLAVFFCRLANASDDKLGVTADFPAVSPVTNEVVFSGDLDGPTRLWVIGANGQGLRKISKTWQGQTNVFEVEPAWSPDGRYISYVSIADGHADIWVVHADGTYAIQLTHNGANNTQPAWSPDGRKIAFVSDKDGTKDIWLMNADGSGANKMVGLSGEENRPSFSPDGSRIVFSESNDSVATLMIASLDGSKPQAITTGTFQDWDPNWGPGGIVFSSNRDGSGHWKVWAVQPDGSGLHAIGNFKGLAPVWMKDGRVAFTEELAQSRALVSISLLDPRTNAKQVLVDIQGYPVPIDIRPGSAQNNVNPKSQGKIDVAILPPRILMQ